METIAAVAAKKLGKFLADDFRDIFGFANPANESAERLGSLARSTIECIARSDALYHNYEHTMLVTMVGRDILRGRVLSQRIEPQDYSHLICACLLHDIGFVRGVLKGDTRTEFVVDQAGTKVTLPRGASDAALMPYHVDRSKLFAYERLGNTPRIDPARVAEAIEMTRFLPYLDERENADLEARLTLASDLIGQLGDPLYPKKANALFVEFEEVGINRQFGYENPGGSRRQVSRVLLRAGCRAYRGGGEIPVPDRLGPPVGGQPPQSRLVRRARQLARDGPAALTGAVSPAARLAQTSARDAGRSPPRGGRWRRPRRARRRVPARRGE